MLARTGPGMIVGKVARIVSAMVPVHPSRGDLRNGSGDHGSGYLGRLARIVSGIVPMRWEVMSVMPVITADIMSGIVPMIVAMAHPEDRADDHSRQDYQGH
jgi:hypothetical protein